MPEPKQATSSIVISKIHILFAVILVLSSFFIPALGFISCILITAFLLGHLKKFTYIEALALAILLFFASTIVFYSLITLTHVHFKLEYVPSVILTLIIGVTCLKYKKNIPRPSWENRKKSDVLSTAIAVITFFLLLIPITHQTPSYIAQFLSYGEDNASHYALSRYIDQKGSFTYNQSSEEAGLVSSLEIYPQGFHVNASLFASLIKPFHISEERFIKLYALFISLLYALFTFWLIKLCTYKIEKISWVIALSALPAVALAGSLSFFLLMLYRGFQPQVFAFTFLLSSIFCLMIFDSEKKYIKQAIFIIFMLAVGIAASWWFLLFVLFTTGIFYAIKNRISFAILKEKRFAIALLAPLLGILYPILTNIILSKKHDPISEPGGVDILPLDFILYVAIASLILPFVIRLKDRALFYLYVALGSSVLLAIVIGAYHLLRIGHFEYYFYKIIYAILAFLIIIACIGILLLANKLFHALSRYLRLIIPGILIGGVIIVATLSNLVFIKVYINNWFPNSVEVIDTPILFTNQTDSYNDILFLGDCSPASDYLSNRWAGARLLSESTARAKLSISIFKGDWVRTNTYLKEYLSNNKNILVSIDRRCESKLPILNDLSSYGHVEKIYTH